MARPPQLPSLQPMTNQGRAAGRPHVFPPVQGALKATRRAEAKASARNFSHQTHLSNERTYEIQTHQRRQASFQTIAQIELVGKLHRPGLSARIDVGQETRAASD